MNRRAIWCFLLGKTHQITRLSALFYCMRPASSQVELRHSIPWFNDDLWRKAQHQSHYSREIVTLLVFIDMATL